MSAIAIENQSKEIQAYIVVLRALERLNVMFYAPIITWNCFAIRMEMPDLISDIRSLDSCGLTEKDIRMLYIRCRRLHRRCLSLEKRLGPLSGWLFKKPTAELGTLCEDLALAIDPEARALVRKIAAAATSTWKS